MEIIRLGNIENRDIGKTMQEIYLGSGDMGASFDRFGGTDAAADRGFMHGDLYATDSRYGSDAHVAALKMRLEGVDHAAVRTYCQQLDLYDGLLTTSFCTQEYSYTAKAGFHTECRDIFAAEYEWDGETLPQPVFVPAPQPDDMAFCGTPELYDLREENGMVAGRIHAGSTGAVVKWKVVGDARLVWQDQTVRLCLKPGKGRAVLLMGLCRDAREEALDAQFDRIPVQQALTDVAESWHRKWGESRISFEGRDDLLKLFYRCVFHILCSFSENARFLAPPLGWTGKKWRRHFPQDVGYIVPVLLRLGYVDILKGMVELYERYIDALRVSTKRVFGCEGVLWAWEFPIGDGKAYLMQEEVPYPYLYEIHNSVYPAKLAWQTAKVLSDPEWSRSCAWRVIKASADFYASGAVYNGKTWDIDIQPAMGQDEMGGVGQKNYLCALYAAKYTLTIAVSAAKEWGISCGELPKWERILSDGLAFDKLVHPQLGIYMNFEGDWRTYQLHEMKHPIPLNPLSFIPLGEPDRYERRAFELRYDLCVPLPTVLGWTLADILLAAAHLGDREAFWEAIELFRVTEYVDPDWSGVYESGKYYDAYPYVTSEGLFCDAILNGAVCDFWGDVRYQDLGFQNLKYKNLHLLDGSVVSCWD